MKFARKTKTDDKRAQQPAQPAAGKKQKPVADRKKRSRRLGNIALGQAVTVLLAAAVSVLLFYFLVVQPGVVERARSQARYEVENAALRLNQYLNWLQQSVEGLAAQSYVREALADSAAADVAVAQLKAALPGVAAAYLFPFRKIPGSASGQPLLGFAGLELARRAETGQQLLPDAFPKDNQWYLQLAAPVRNPVTGAMAGSLLMVFDMQGVRSQLKVVNPELGGQLALLQTVSGASRTLASQGSGSGQPVSRTLVNPDWSVEYRPAREPAPPVSIMWLILLVGGPALVAALLVWILTGRVQHGLRKDISELVQWAQKVFAGDRVRPPRLHWDIMQAAGEAFARIAQVVDRRVSKASEAAAPRRVAEPEPAVPDEPLFQNAELPDIDMLDSDEDVLGLGDSNPDAAVVGGLQVEEVPAPPPELVAEIFRAYDIRGIVGETLSADVVQLIGQAIGSEALDRGIERLCVGYDGRHSSPELADALCRGLMATGCHVIRIGRVPTPVLYFATHELETGSGVMVTGSHNPASYNGLKIMLGGETLHGEAIQKLYRRIRNGDLARGQGEQSSQDVRRAYLDRIVGDIAVAAPLKVVVDAGNGIAGELAPVLIEDLGCEVIPMYCEVDGDFPHHHPDPGRPENLADLIARVQAEEADLGIAFDGDGDRLGVVTNTGRIIWPDRLMMLFARDVVARNPGADVLFDVKCSRRLASVITEAGGRPIMWKSGHSLMKAKMKETGALLAGEMSGHIFFGERWYGFDDGLYAAARLLEILGIEDRHSDEVFADFPEDISTPEINLAVDESRKFGLVERLAAEGDFGDGSVTTIDGIRVDYADGWGLCRASNTTPALVLRFEAVSGEALSRIQGVFREQLQKVAPDLTVDF